MAQTCDGLTLAGPFPQTLFLGCSVVSFTASVGWDGQPSTLTVQLVEDNCPSPNGSHKTYWDASLQQQQWIEADPGFIGLTNTITGCAVYFRVANFEFAGIIQGWEKSQGTSANPAYKVTIIDPHELLKHSVAIIGEYAGSVYNLYNVFNVYGFLESLTPPIGTSVTSPPYSLQINEDGNPIYQEGNLNPDGITFGSNAYGYGNAEVNNNGILWLKLLQGLNILTSCAPKINNAWSPYGRLVYRGISLSASPLNYGFGLLGADGANFDGFYNEYFLDLSALPTPPEHWRISGDNIDLSNLIAQICEACGYNYYIELVLIRNSPLSPSSVTKIIKVRTVRRALQPSLGQISTFVTANTDGSVEVAYGEELRNETTSALCYGGPKETLYQMTNPATYTLQNGQSISGATIYPYFGTDPWTGNIIVPYREGDEWVICVRASLFNTTLSQISEIGEDIGGVKYAYIRETEMMAALAGYSVWEATVTALGDKTDGDSHPKSSTGKAILESGKHGIWDIGNAFAEFDDAVEKIDIRMLLSSIVDKLQLNKKSSKEWEEINSIYNWVKTFADNLGKKFMLRVPFACCRVDTDSGQIISSENPTNGGWTEQTSILGIGRNSLLSNFMKLPDNKFAAMLVFDDAGDLFKKDTSYLGEYYFIYNDRIYVRADVEPEYKYENWLLAYNPVAILTLPGGLININDAMSQDIRGLYKLVDICVENETTRNQIKAKLDEVHGAEVGTKIVHIPYPYDFDTEPIGGCCGIKSNILTYGPWYKAGKMGGVNIRREDSLVPWEFNGYTEMNVAGNALATEGLTNMQIGEKGTITVAGYPVIPLGAELGSYAGGAYGGGSQLIENRISSLEDSGYGNYTYAKCELPDWTGLYGPNITDINVGFASDGIKTQYTMRTYTPKFGRFTQQNVNKLKAIGQLQIKLRQRWASQWLLPNVHGQLNAEIRAGQRQLRLTAKDVGIQVAQHTPQDVLAGVINTVSTGNGYSVSHVVAEPLCDLHNELSGYANKAFLSLDGVFRPVSIDGDGGLPKLAIPATTSFATTLSAQPPVYKNTSAETLEYNLAMWGKQIQPLQNPTAYDNHDAVDRTASPDENQGHDIAIVGRESAPPSGDENTGMMICNLHGITSGNYADDYRTFALKGPLLLHSWGYDTEGRPVPNSGDVNAGGGQFLSIAPSERFSSNWLRKPETWPVAPIDLRYDRYRGVWTTPPEHSLVIGRLLTDVTPFGNGTVLLTDGPPLYDASGNALSYNTMAISVKDRLGHFYASGTKIQAYWNKRITNDVETTGEYHILENTQSYQWCQISDDLYECSSIGGYIIPSEENSVDKTSYAHGRAVTVQDTYNTIANSLLAIEGDGGLYYMPKDSLAFCKITPTSGNSPIVDVIAWGKGCGGSSSASAQSSSSVPSSSLSTSSESQSESSQGSSEGSSDGGSSKSAIVEASWSKTGYAAIFITESPEVRLEDVMSITLTKRTMRFPIDPCFVEICEKDSLQVCGCVPDIPIAIGAKVENGEWVKVQVSRFKPSIKIRVVLHLTGIRRGFYGMRFSEKTRKQYLANEKFIKMAYGK